MALPLNTQTTISGISVVVKEPAGTIASQGPVTPGGYNSNNNSADQYVNANSGAAGSNLNYATGGGNKGLKIPDFSGLDKALGVLGAAVALADGAQNLVSGIANLGSGALAAGSALLAAGKNAFGKANSSTSESPAGGSYVSAQAASGDWRVRIDANFDVFGTNKFFDLLKETNGVVFPFTPTISITHKANYTTPELVHNNYPHLAYKNSQVDDITIQGEFSVQSQEDGLYWLAATSFLRSATKMFYGQSTPAGNPPVVCRLSGYGPMMFDQVPVVIKSFQMDLKDSVQYKRIEASQFGISGGQWVPLTSTFTVVVSPIYNRAKMRQFKLADYAAGKNKGVL